MRRKVKLSDNLLNKMEAYSPSIHEDIETIKKEAEVDEICVKRGNTPGAAAFKIDKSEERTVVGMSSTRFIDRDQEIIVPKGVDLSQYRKAPVKLWNHQHDIVVGKNVAIKAVKDGLLSKTALADTERALDVFKLIQFGAVSTNSIGFIPTKVFSNGGNGWGSEVDRLKKLWPDFTTKMADGVRHIISKCVMLEDSFAPVAANIDSKLIAVSEKNMKYIEKSLEALGVEVEVVEEDVEDELYAYYKSLEIPTEDDNAQEFDEDTEAREKAANGGNLPKSVENVEEEVNTKDKSDVDPLSTIRLISKAKIRDPRLVALANMTQDELVEWHVRKNLGYIR